ncbi:hypothetical protein ACWEG1_05910 [Streptomyces bauhiniae]
MRTLTVLKSWRLIVVTPSGEMQTQHHSEPETYRAVTAERERITSGSSNAIRIRVEKWDDDTGRWKLFELLRRGINL